MTRRYLATTFSIAVAGALAIAAWTPPCGDRLGSLQFFSPAHRADRPAVHHRPALVEPSPSAQLGEEGLMQASPDAGPFAHATQTMDFSFLENSTE